MALLNRPFTEKEIEQALSTPVLVMRPSFIDFLIYRSPTVVHYDGIGKPWSPPKSTYLVCKPPARSPSACEWIVPGSGTEE